MAIKNIKINNFKMFVIKLIFSYRLLSVDKTSLKILAYHGDT